MEDWLDTLNPVKVRSWADYEDLESYGELNFAQFAQGVHDLYMRTVTSNNGKSAYHFEIDHTFIDLMFSGHNMVLSITPDKRKHVVSSEDEEEEYEDDDHDDDEEDTTDAYSSEDEQDDLKEGDTEEEEEEEEGKAPSVIEDNRFYVFNDSATCPYMGFSHVTNDRKDVEAHAHTQKWSHAYQPATNIVCNYGDYKNRSVCREYPASENYQRKFHMWFSRYSQAPPDPRHFLLFTDSSSWASNKYIGKVQSLRKTREWAKKFRWCHAVCVRTRDVYDFWINRFGQFSQKRSLANQAYFDKLLVMRNSLPASVYAALNASITSNVESQTPGAPEPAETSSESNPHSPSSKKPVDVASTTPQSSPSPATCHPDTPRRGSDVLPSS